MGVGRGVWVNAIGGRWRGRFDDAGRGEVGETGDVAAELETRVCGARLMRASASRGVLHDPRDARRRLDVDVELEAEGDTSGYWNGMVLVVSGRGEVGDGMELVRGGRAKRGVDGLG